MQSVSLNVINNIICNVLYVSIIVKKNRYQLLDQISGLLTIVLNSSNAVFERGPLHHAPLCPVSPRYSLAIASARHYFATIRHNSRKNDVPRNKKKSASFEMHCLAAS